MRRVMPLLVVVALVLVAAAAAVRAPARVDDRPSSSTAQSQVEWRARVLELQGRVRRLRRELLRRWNYPHLIALAAIAYNADDRTLERKARCESVDFTDFVNEESGARNVFQFLPSTWATTPYARFSIDDPFAAVLAGAWMHARGRGGEWACK